MANIGIIRCEKNEGRCPLTGCLKSLRGTREGFTGYDDAEIIGIFTCKCPGDNVVPFAKILKQKGADAIHFCTCTFAQKNEGGWVMGNGFCDHIDQIIKNTAEAVSIPCVKGTAHLPQGYKPEVF